MIKDNTYVQELLSTAIALIKPSSDPIVDLKIQTIKNSLQLIKLYSASCNSIPGLRGLGLEEALKLSEHIIAKEGDITNVHLNFKALSNIVKL
jgi:hypothetical protein